MVMRCNSLCAPSTMHDTAAVFGCDDAGTFTWNLFISFAAWRADARRIDVIACVAWVTSSLQSLIVGVGNA